jgi:16S rRNA (guanine(966)-N(2))-methyltransferase RsmD
VRIISGSHRGRIIRAPALRGVRPTTDFAKTGLFNVLQHRFEWPAVTAVDLFCGTGNITWEFLSRGARQVVAVDAQSGCIRFVKKTAAALGFQNLRAVHADALQFLRAFTGPCDVLFADPPYDYDAYDALIAAAARPGLLNAGGLAVVEHAARSHFGEHPTFVMRKTYGQTAFSFFGAAPPA